MIDPDQLARDRSTWVAAAPRADGMIVVRSREYGETVLRLDTRSLECA